MIVKNWRCDVCMQHKNKKTKILTTPTTFKLSVLSLNKVGRTFILLIITTFCHFLGGLYFLTSVLNNILQVSYIRVGLTTRNIILL